ncbi:MAG: ATP-grasp domain-containing protein [Planctomycetaceae bacterium]
MRRILISESICGGGCADPHPPASLVREGRAMLSAVLADFCRVADAEIWTTWDRRRGEHQLAGASVIGVSSPNEERRAWHELIGEITDVLLIAPESAGVLAERAEFFERHGCRLLGPSSSAIRLCGDKWETFRLLSSHRIPTVETSLLSRGHNPLPTNIHRFVLKPRDGAGSQEMELFERMEDIDFNKNAGYLLQPFIAGTPLSCSAMIDSTGDVEVFPIGRQFIGVENKFAYGGGEIPVEPALAANVQQAIHTMIRDVCRLIPGLRGYVGFDLILPDQSPHDPIVVEINPRLTTSYLGYRQLTPANLAERMLDRDHRTGRIRWNIGETIRFSPEWNSEAASPT